MGCILGTLDVFRPVCQSKHSLRLIRSSMATSMLMHYREENKGRSDCTKLSDTILKPLQASLLASPESSFHSDLLRSHSFSLILDCTRKWPAVA